MSKLAPQMSLGFNVVVTMATCFVAGFFVFKASSGSDTVGMIGGIAGMIVAMGVEAVLLITRMYSIEHEAERQAKKRWRVVEARR